MNRFALLLLVAGSALAAPLSVTTRGVTVTVPVPTGWKQTVYENIHSITVQHPSLDRSVEVYWGSGLDTKTMDQWEADIRSWKFAGSCTSNREDATHMSMVCNSAGANRMYAFVRIADDRAVEVKASQTRVLTPAEFDAFLGVVSGVTMTTDR